MCLSIISERVARPTSEVIIAWKVFRKDFRQKMLRSGLRLNSQRYYYNRWYRSPYPREHDECYVPYFHAFKTRESARFYSEEYVTDGMVRKVKLRYITVKGEQKGKAFVAKEMLILRSKG